MKGGRNDTGRGAGHLRGAAVAFSLGFQLLASALGGFYLGSLLDRARYTTFFAPAGLLVGLLAGLHRIYLLVRTALKKGD